MQKIILKDWLEYIERRKLELNIGEFGDEYKNQGPRTPDKIELLKRIEQRKNSLDKL